MSNPLLTFALVSCNQEAFVPEAVSAAFAQTYSPLEIILSDDYSDDRSFDIMREMAATYRGPHQVKLNRNPARRKTGGHFNRVLELAQGELIVIAAADDVSLPHRTARLFEAWNETGRRHTSLYSDVIQIDESGREIETLFELEQRKFCPPGQYVEDKGDAFSYLQSLKPAVHGCAHAIMPDLFRVFGNLPDEVMYEDKVLAFRSVLIGSVLYLNEPMVRYRMHGANILKYRKSSDGASDMKALEQQENRLVRNYRETSVMYRAFVQDLGAARRKKLIPEAGCEKWLREAQRQQSRFSLMADFLEGGIFAKCKILLQLQKFGGTQAERDTLLRRLLPRSLFLRLRLARSRGALAG